MLTDSMSHYGRNYAASQKLESAALQFCFEVLLSRFQVVRGALARPGSALVNPLNDDCVPKNHIRKKASKGGSSNYGY